jgi:predicted Fe-Mo cluster-binding NifX family protein/Pyruvate/2-oxoacid:ferredoxin oxidoreductase delta subunit
MRVAVTKFGSTISPLFDSAQRLLVADVGSGGVRVLKEEAIGDLDLAQRMALLSELGVRALACGAINGFTHNALVERGIAVFPWISGEVEDLLGLLVTCYTARTGSRTDLDLAARVAVPSIGVGLKAMVAPSIRQSNHLQIVETKDLRCTTADGKEIASGGWCYRLAGLILEADARVLLVGRCGPNALGILGVAGVEVIQGVEGRVGDAVAAYRGGRLSDASHSAGLGGAGQLGPRGRGGWRHGLWNQEGPRGGGLGRGGHRGRRRGYGRRRGEGIEDRGKGRRAMPLPQHRGRTPTVDQEKCSGCSTCELVCPTGAIKVDMGGLARIDPAKCACCWTCVEVCPEQAAHVPS